MSFFVEVARWFGQPGHWTGEMGIPNRLAEHVAMSGLAALTAAAIALPIGCGLGHVGKLGNVAINASNIGRAIPSFAILVLALQVFGIGAKPAFIALVLLAIPPMLTNAYVGVREVDPGLREAARGLGYRELAILWRVELPNAMPVLMSGVRTAGVQVVATATLAALVAWGGLGRFIVDGLSQRDFVQVFAGALLVAALSLLTELALAALQFVSTPRGLRRRPRAESGRNLARGVAQFEPAA